MVQTMLPNTLRPFSLIPKHRFTSLFLVLCYLFITTSQNQIAFAAQASKPSKKVSCISSAKSSKSRKTCVSKPKAPAKGTAPTTNVISAPVSDPTFFLKTDSTSCKLPSQNTRGDVEAGFPRIANRAPSIGEIQSAMIFVDFSDAPAANSPKSLYSYFDSASPLLKQLSYGRANLHISTDLQWHRMSRSSTAYGQDLKSSFTGLRSFISEAIALASATQDFSKVDVVYVVANPDAKKLTGSMAFVARPGYEISVAGTSIANGAFFGSNTASAYPKTLVHETSHTFGLVDDWNVNYDTSNLSDAFRFTGNFSIMGTLFGTAPHYLAWESWLMGWLDDTQINCLAPVTQSLTLQALETSGGVKMAMIPLSSTKAAVIEYRRPLLADANLTAAGVLIYTVDTSIASADGPLRVIGGTTSHYLTDALLTTGGQRSVDGIQVKVTRTTNDSATISVTIS